MNNCKPTFAPACILIYKWEIPQYSKVLTLEHFNMEAPGFQIIGISSFNDFVWNKSVMEEI